jgi:hypothetical protein
MAFDLSLPPIPPNGFPDEDEAPIVLSDDAQSVQESVELSIPQRNESTVPTPERANEERPLRERLSFTRNDGRSTPYERAAAKYDFKEHFQANEFVSIPGKPLFLPRNRAFSWNEVRYAEHPCRCCSIINESRPKEAPLLPCLATLRFDRCVYCVSTNQGDSCSVGEDLRASRVRSQMQYPQTALPHMHLWENDSSYRGHSYRTAHNYALSSSYNNRTGRSSEYDHGDIQHYDSVDNRKRKRRSSIRESSPIGSGSRQSRTTRPLDAPLIEASSDIQPPPKTTAIDHEANRVSDSAAAAVDAFFPNVNNEAIETINSNADPILNGAHPQSPSNVNSKARVSFLTIASTPPLADSNDDELSCMLNQIDGWVRGKEEFKDKILQLQDRYNRRESEMEKLQNKNEQLSQSADKWFNQFKKAESENEELKDQLKTIQSRNGNEELEKLKNDVLAAFDQYELA